MIREIKKLKELKELVNESTVPVVVKFWAPWCNPCKSFAPSYEKLALEGAGEAIFYQVNVDESADISDEYGIMSIPQVMVFNSEVEYDQYNGTDTDRIKEIINQDWGQLI